MNESAGTRAYLHARPDATPEQLEQVNAAIKNRGWKAVPILYDGKPVLEVRGFKQPEKALSEIESNGWTLGTPTVEAQEGDTRSRAEKMRNTTLKAAGISYNVGDAAYMTYTIKKFIDGKPHNNATGNFFNKLDIIGGVGYSLGSLALTNYGSRDQSQNVIQAAGKKVQSYIKREGTAVDNDSALKEIVREPPRTLWGKLDHTFAKYPSETLNTVYVGVGGILSSAALYRTISAFSKGHHAAGREEAWDVGLGMVTGASALTGLLVKEKKIEDEDRRHGVGKILDWIQERPLRATGFGYMVATMFHGVGTYKKYYSTHTNSAEIKQIRETIVFRGIFVLANVVSEVLLSLSSKGHGIGVKPDKSIDETVIAAAAETIARSDSNQQVSLIQRVSGYMASPDVLDGKSEDIANTLRTQVTAMKTNPWAHKIAAATSKAEAAPNTTEKPDAKVRSAEHKNAITPPTHGLIA